MKKVQMPAQITYIFVHLRRILKTICNCLHLSQKSEEKKWTCRCEDENEEWELNIDGYDAVSEIGAEDGDSYFDAEAEMAALTPEEVAQVDRLFRWLTRIPEESTE